MMLHYSLFNYRWKGENVSTTEVANIMTSLSFIVDVNVYGVPVPGNVENVYRLK